MRIHGSMGNGWSECTDLHTSMTGSEAPALTRLYNRNVYEVTSSHSFGYKGPRLWNLLDPRFKEVNSGLTDFKVTMRTWQGGDCECNTYFLYLVHSTQVWSFYDIQCIDVIVYIIVHPRHLSIVHASSHLIPTQHCRQIVLHKPTLNKTLFHSIF